MTKPMTAAQQAQQSNRTGDGKYTTKTHSESEVNLRTDHPPVPRIDSQGNDWGPAFAQYQRQSIRQHDIMYIHYDDAFSDDFVDSELSGDLNRINAGREAEEHWEWENDAYTSGLRR